MSQRAVSPYRHFKDPTANRPDFTTESKDITVRIPNVSPYYQFKCTRPDFTTDSNDIKNEAPYNGCPIRQRHTFPVNPVYKLPQYESAIIPELQQKYDFECKDIAGTSPVSSLYNKQLKKIPQERNLNLEVKDINSVQIFNATVIHPRDPDMNLNVSDITSLKHTLQRPIDTDPLNPRYNYPNAEAEIEPKTYNKFYDRSPLIYDNQLRTDDIDGLYQEKLTKQLFKYGKRQQLINILKTDDLKQKPCKKEGNRNKAFTIRNITTQSADLIGQEFKDKQIVKPIDSFSTRTYGNPNFMSIGVNRDDVDAPGINSGYLIQNTDCQNSPGMYDIPEYIPPPKETLYVTRYARGEDPSKIPVAGLNMHGLDNAIKPECTGLLPGPSDEYYKMRSFKHQHEQECIHVADDFNWDDAVGSRTRFQKRIELGKVPENCLARPGQCNKVQLQKLSKTVAPRTFSGQFTLRKQGVLSPSSRERQLPREKQILTPKLANPQIVDPDELERIVDATLVEQLPW